MNALTTMGFANTLGLLVKTYRAVIAAFVNQVFFWTIVEEHAQVKSFPFFIYCDYKQRNKARIISVKHLPLAPT